MRRFFTLKKLMFLAVLFLVSHASFFLYAKLKDSRIQGMVDLPNGQSLYVDYMMPEKGFPTLILLNGLTYNTTNWDRFVDQIKDSGYGILRYDMRGMGKTFKAGAPVRSPIPYMDQVEDLKLLIEEMNFEQKPILMGLSYGGGIGLAFNKKYADSVDHTILLAPYTRPLEGQDNMFKLIIKQENMIRSMFFLPTKDPAQAYSELLKKNVDYVYPLAEPGDWDHDSIFNMTEGIRVWNALEDSDIHNLSKSRSITLVAALFDQYVEYPTLSALSGILTDNGALRSFEKVWSEHKIPESNPIILADLWKKLSVQLQAEKINASSSPRAHRKSKTGGIIFKSNSSNSESETVSCSSAIK